MCGSRRDLSQRPFGIARLIVWDEQSVPWLRVAAVPVSVALIVTGSFLYLRRANKV
jgi:hypothetical protein